MYTSALALSRLIAPEGEEATQLKMGAKRHRRPSDLELELQISPHVHFQLLHVISFEFIIPRATFPLRDVDGI